MPSRRTMRASRTLSALVAASLILSLLGLSLGLTVNDTPSLEDLEQALADQLPSDGPEARAWLASSPSPGGLAGNRFANSTEALAFVDQLYALGAVKVFVDGIYQEPDASQRSAGPYADSLVIILPDDTAARQKLFALAAAEAEREGFKPERDRGQSKLLLWWD